MDISNDILVIRDASHMVHLVTASDKISYDDEYLEELETGNKMHTMVFPKTLENYETLKVGEIDDKKHYVGLATLQTPGSDTSVDTNGKTGSRSV